MKCFSTFYAVEGVEHMSYVFADSSAKAEELVKQRNIGERIDGLLMGQKLSFMTGDLPSKHYHNRKLTECMHGISFYGWIAAKSGLLKPDLVPDLLLGDNGILHDVVHEIQFPRQFGFREEIHKKITNLEMLVPGLKM